MQGGDGRSCYGGTGVSSLCRNHCAVPPGLDFVPHLLPGTYVPGFPVSPLRGRSNCAVHFFTPLGVATQTRRPSSFGVAGRGRAALHSDAC